MATVTLDIPDQVRDLAKAQGQTVEEFVGRLLARCIEEVLEDAEDARIASERLRDIDSGQVQTISHEDLWREMDALPD